MVTVRAKTKLQNGMVPLDVLFGVFKAHSSAAPVMEHWTYLIYLTVFHQPALRWLLLPVQHRLKLITSCRDESVSRGGIACIVQLLQQPQCFQPKTAHAGWVQRLKRVYSIAITHVCTSFSIMHCLRCSCLYLHSIMSSSVVRKDAAIEAGAIGIVAKVCRQGWRLKGTML